jgi:hypothetical protein
VQVQPVPVKALVNAASKVPDSFYVTDTVAYAPRVLQPLNERLLTEFGKSE